MGLPRTTTHCPYCALQCGISLTVDRGGVSVSPENFPTNRGGLCVKGWTAAELIGHPERLRKPLVRAIAGDRHSPLREAGWDEALDRTVAAISAGQERYGRNSVGCFGGGGLTNEKAYLLGKFARVGLRTASIDYNGRFCMSSAATAMNAAFGVDRGLPFPLADVERTGALLLVGSNLADTMPPAMRYLDELRRRGGQLVVVDPRGSATAKGATLHLRPVPGTDLALANGLLYLALRAGYVDEAYVKARTRGFGEVRAGVAAYWPDRVERITGVPVAELERTVEILGSAPDAMILTARGAEQHREGSDTAQAFINLALALGLPGRPYSGYGSITGQGNGQGGREHGQKADQLPGYRRIDDPAAREHVAGVWGIDPEELPGPGPSAYEMLSALGTGTGVRTLLVFASNVVVSAPGRDHVLERIRSLDFLAVSDIFLSETAQEADVVFPAAQWAEEEGTMTNLEGRVIRRRRALAPPGEVRDDLQIITDLADRLGRGEYFSADPRAVFEELGRASAGGAADYSGIRYDRIEAEKGVFWPCKEGEPGTQRLFTDRFATPDGRARFVRVDHRGAAEQPTEDYPYVLTTGRLMRQYQSGTQTRRVPALAAEPNAEMHPDLARRHGIEPGDRVELRTRRGRAVFPVELTDGIRPDTVFVPFHWGGESSANALTDPALDPRSRMPAFKACAVAIGGVIRPAGPPPQERTEVDSIPRFLQGIFSFTGKGMDAPYPLASELRYVVPDGAVGQLVYLRGGNSSDELVCVVLMRDGTPMRYFPIGAKDGMHVSLRVVEDLEPGTTIEVFVAAPDGTSGSLVVDLGMVEV
ncbi:molybdopterin oxidoreductase family protein [Sphaerisporangium aureirubrum]|uniref:Molybdopterin oxidoreductase family protein n=1 Tax=Sphaerisporangium aureirubrum TaxID=1544736 RepID=A0ABW1NBX8_9ACTN